MGVSVVIERTAFQRLVGGRAGQALLRRRAERVAQRARELSANNGSIPDGIEVGPVIGNKVSVISTNPHTLFVHNGTRKHIILPRTKQFLRFTVGGRVVYARVVHHPGTKANPFLVDAMRQVG